MTTPSSMKIRLVLCPRCREVLPELPDISLYQCGGCGTILQAKHRKMEANHARSTVTTIQRDSFQKEGEAISCNLDSRSPPKEEKSSKDKNVVVFEDGVESGSEQSEYRSAYDGLCSSPEFNPDTGECSLRLDSEIYYYKLHDSDEDSSGSGKLSDEFPSSMEAREWKKEHDNIYLDRSTKLDQFDGEQSSKVWLEGEKLLNAVRLFYGHEDRDGRLPHVNTNHRQGRDDNYADEVTSSYHDLTSPPEEESSLDKDSRNASTGLLSMPDPDHSLYEDSPVEGSVIRNRVKCCLGLDSKRYVRELHNSDGESSTGGNFSGEIPSSSELVIHRIGELAQDAKRAGNAGIIYLDQPTQSDKCEVEFPDHDDQVNGWPPVSAQHMEGICNCNVILEKNDVSLEEPRSSNHGLNCQHKEEFLPDKDRTRYHDEHVESSTELSDDRSISSGLLSSPEIKVSVSKDMDESLYHDNTQDLKRSNIRLFDLGDEEDSFFDRARKVGTFEGGESIEMCQKIDNILHDVHSIPEHEDLENGLPTVSTEHREGITNNHVHPELDDVSKEVSGITKHGEGINNNCTHLESDDVSKEVARDHTHLENDDVSREVAGSLNHDLASPPNKEDLSLDKANVRFHDEHVESWMKFSMIRTVPNDLSGAPQVNCCQNEDPLVEESLNKDRDRNSLAPDFKKYDNRLHDLDDELSLSAEIRSSNELFSHEIEELIPEATEHAKECYKSILDHPTILEPVQGEKSLPMCQEGDNIRQEVHNFSCQEGTRRAGVGSSTADIVSYIDGDASAMDDGFRGSPSFNRKNTNSPNVGDTVVVSQVVSMGLPANLRSLDDKQVDRSPKKGSQTFGGISSVELLGASLFSETSPELSVKPKDTSSPVTTRGYYVYDGSESSNDETDDQFPVYVPHSSRRKGKEVDYSCTTRNREGFAVENMMSSEPEMEYGASSPANQNHAISYSHGNSDEFTETKSRIPTSGDIMRVNEGGSSRLPFTSRNLHANQRWRGPSVHRNNLPPLHPGFHPDTNSYLEPDKMDLLRTVCELKDQLNRIQYPKISRDRRLPAGVTRETFSSSSFYYDHLIPERERHVGWNRHGNYRWYNQEKGRVKHSNVSALALSGEGAYYRHQVNCSCLHCRTRDWHSSAPLLPHISHYHVRSLAPISHNSRNISSPLSTLNHSSCECLVPGQETMSDYQSSISNKMKRFDLRDKYHASKRHLRPVAGGSPFVTCYHCSETLQLPADFLVFRKRCHQLRCRACSKVLKFSHVGGKHIVPYFSHGLEAGTSNVTNEVSVLAMTHSNPCQHGVPVSCSDDNGRSFCRSCPTEGEALVSLPSSGLVKMNTYERMISSVSSYEATGDRNMKYIMKNSMEKEKNKNNSPEQPKFVNPSSEFEELSPSPNSPLHRLMGYSSISQVLNNGSEINWQR